MSQTNKDLSRCDVVNLIEETIDIFTTFDDRLSYKKTQDESWNVTFNSTSGPSLAAVAVFWVHLHHMEIRMQESQSIDATDACKAIYQGPYEESAIRQTLSMRFARWYQKLIHQLAST